MEVTAPLLQHEGTRRVSQPVLFDERRPAVFNLGAMPSPSGWHQTGLVKDRCDYYESGIHMQQGTSPLAACRPMWRQGQPHSTFVTNIQ